jgi:hypothetical protein
LPPHARGDVAGSGLAGFGADMAGDLEVLKIVVVTALIALGGLWRLLG